MSLDRFIRTNLVVLRPTATVYEAARAMSDNRIGAVLVADDAHRLVGIVTDRDLALRLVERDLDTRDAIVGDVMSPIAGSCDLTATIEDVIVAMRQLGSRRLAITEHGKPVGLVTLDDLVLGDAVDLGAIRSVIEAQLRQPARLKPAGALHPGVPKTGGHSVNAANRHRGRADRAYAKFVRAVARHAPPSAAEHAEAALRVAIPMLCERLRPEDAKRLLAQLPSMLALETESQLGTCRKDITAEAIEREVERRLGVSPRVTAGLVDGIFRALAEELSPGGLTLLRSHLPERLRERLVFDGVRDAV